MSSIQQPLLTVSGVTLGQQAQPIDEVVHAGEIVGLAGLDGHGQEPFIEVLAGVRRPLGGRVEVVGADGARPIRSLRDALAASVGYMPADRKHNGIFPGLSVLDNFRLGGHGRFAKAGVLNTQAAKQSLARFKDDLSMVYASTGTPINSLSGGNQQKVLLARVMAVQPRLLLLNDPTRGVDIGTRRVIYRFFRDAVAQRGLTLVVLSTELEEVLDFCDRVIIFRNHEVSARFDKAEMTMDRLMAAMFGHVNAAEAAS